jgi:hypothetical protein
MKKLVLRGLAAAAVVALPVVPTALPAAADQPLQQGWWTRTNPGGPTLPKSSPSDVPADGLLVQGGATGPTALSALVYSIDNGATVGQLKLTVASNTGTTPGAKVEVCPLADASMVPEQGGPMSDAPSYDCKTNVTASPDKSGKTYAFNVASFVSRGDLAVAILATKPTDRVVFSKPSTSSLPVTQPVAPTAPPPATGAPVPASNPAPLAPASDASLGAAPPVESGPSLPTTATTPPEPQVAPTPTPTTTPMPSGFAAASAGPGPGKSSPAAVGLALGAVALAAALWAYAGRNKDHAAPEEA